MNDWISMYKHMSSHILCMKIRLMFLIQNVKILSLLACVAFLLLSTKLS